MTESKVRAKRERWAERDLLDNALQRMEARNPSRHPCNSCGSPDCWLGANFASPQYNWRWADVTSEVSNDTMWMVVQDYNRQNLNRYEYLNVNLAVFKNITGQVTITEEGKTSPQRCNTCWVCVEIPLNICPVTGAY